MIDWLLVFTNVTLFTVITLGASYAFGMVMFCVTELWMAIAKLMGKSYVLHIVGSALPKIPECPKVFQKYCGPYVMHGVAGWQAAICVLSSVMAGIVFSILVTSSLLSGTSITEKTSLENITVVSIKKIDNDDAVATVVISGGKPSRVEVRCGDGIAKNHPDGWLASWNGVTLKAPVDFRRHLFTNEKPVQIPVLKGLICNV